MMIRPTANEGLKLQRQLCFALYSATHAITRSYRSALAAVGLTYPQYLVTLALMEHPSMTSGDLAKALKLDPGTLTPLLKRLAASGLIARQRRIKDERVIDITLTEKGWALEPPLIDAQRLVERRTSFDEAQMAHLRFMLHALTDALSLGPS